MPQAFNHKSHSISSFNKIKKKKKFAFLIPQYPELFKINAISTGYNIFTTNFK